MRKFVLFLPGLDDEQKSVGAVHEGRAMMARAKAREKCSTATQRERLPQAAKLDFSCVLSVLGELL